MATGYAFRIIRVLNVVTIGEKSDKILTNTVANITVNSIGSFFDSVG